MKKNIHRNKNEYSIQQIENSLNVLEQFLGAKNELGITELSKCVGLHKNNVFRVLATLENRGYIEQNKISDNYRLGYKILELAQAFLKHSGVIKVAKPFLEKLTIATNENSYLGLMRNNQVVYVEHANAHHALQVSSRIGIRLTPLCTAIGRVILAFASEQELKTVILNNRFVKHTAKTIVDEDTFYNTLQEVKEQGYAVDQEEYDVGIVCVAAPIFNYEKLVVAGVCVSAPTARVDADILQNNIIPSVLECGKNISAAIGYIS